MVRNENVSCLTIETLVRSSTCLVVFGALTGEGEIDGESLPWYGGFASGRMGTERRFLQLGCNADGAGVKDWVGVLEGRNTINVLVGSIEIGIAWVGKALVP